MNKNIHTLHIYYMYMYILHTHAHVYLDFFFKYMYAPRNIWDTKENATYLKFKYLSEIQIFHLTPIS